MQSTVVQCEFLKNGVERYFIDSYFYLAGKDIALFNASLLCLLNIYALYKMDMKINRLIIAAIYQMLGLETMGKNIFNVIPFYIGGLLYAKIEKKYFKSVFVATMFTTSLSPFVSATLEFRQFFANRLYSLRDYWCHTRIYRASYSSAHPFTSTAVTACITLVLPLVLWR